MAATAATEHFTAIFADWLLRHPEVLDGAEPRLRFDTLTAEGVRDLAPLVAGAMRVLPAGAEDARGIPLEDTIKLLAGAQLVGT